MAARKNEPQPTGDLGPPPSHLSKEQVVCWNELADISAPGVLTNSDRWAVELAACFMAQHRNEPKLMMASSYNLLARLLSQLGMTPADRSRINAASAPKKTNPFGALGA